MTYKTTIEVDSKLVFTEHALARFVERFSLIGQEDPMDIPDMDISVHYRIGKYKTMDQDDLDDTEYVLYEVLKESRIEFFRSRENQNANPEYFVHWKAYTFKVAYDQDAHTITTVMHRNAGE